MREFILRLVICGLVTLVAHPADAQHSRIHLSVDGELGVGDVKYDGGSAVGRMIEFNGGVLTAFSNCGPPNPQAACVHWSQDGQNLGGGPRVYAGSSPVTAMIAFNAGVLTAFSNCGPPNPQAACVHWSQDGQNLGGGPRAYAGSSFVASILPLGAGILTAFNGLPAPTDPNSCPLPSYCLGVVLMCQKGRLGPGDRCVQGSSEPCGVLPGILVSLTHLMTVRIRSSDSDIFRCMLEHVVDKVLGRALRRRYPVVRCHIV